jgi:hypothetical protein
LNASSRRHLQVPSGTPRPAAVPSSTSRAGPPALAPRPVHSLVDMDEEIRPGIESPTEGLANDHYGQLVGALGGGGGAYQTDQPRPKGSSRLMDDDLLG